MGSCASSLCGRLFHITFASFLAPGCRRGAPFSRQSPQRAGGIFLVLGTPEKRRHGAGVSAPPRLALSWYCLFSVMAVAPGRPDRGCRTLVCVLVAGSLRWEWDCACSWPLSDSLAVVAGEKGR